MCFSSNIYIGLFCKIRKLKPKRNSQPRDSRVNPTLHHIWIQDTRGGVGYKGFFYHKAIHDKVDPVLTVLSRQRAGNQLYIMQLRMQLSLCPHVIIQYIIENFKKFPHSFSVTTLFKANFRTMLTKRKRWISKENNSQEKISFNKKINRFLNFTPNF